MKNLIINQYLIIMLLCTPLSMADVVYVHNDALGSPIMESDANGDTVKFHYKPFGETLEAMKDDVGYTGHLNDTDLGLTYMQARYYDPVIGRFYSNDPIGFRDIHSFNRYAYANNNPYKYIDPTGMSSECFLGICLPGSRPSKEPDSGENNTPTSQLEEGNRETIETMEDIADHAENQVKGVILTGVIIATIVPNAEAIAVEALVEEIGGEKVKISKKKLGLAAVQLLSTLTSYVADPTTVRSAGLTPNDVVGDTLRPTTKRKGPISVIKALIKK